MTQNGPTMIQSGPKLPQMAQSGPNMFRKLFRFQNVWVHIESNHFKGPCADTILTQYTN